jgi:hypothetical protein
MKDENPVCTEKNTEKGESNYILLARFEPVIPVFQRSHMISELTNVYPFGLLFISQVVSGCVTPANIGPIIPARKGVNK